MSSGRFELVEACVESVEQLSAAGVCRCTARRFCSADSRHVLRSSTCTSNFWSCTRTRSRRGSRSSRNRLFWRIKLRQSCHSGLYCCSLLSKKWVLPVFFSGNDWKVFLITMAPDIKDPGASGREANRKGWVKPQRGEIISTG